MIINKDRGIFKGMKRCVCCNGKYFMDGYDEKDKIVRLMVKEGICYNCAYWKTIIKSPPQYMEVVNNQCLRIFPKVEKKDKSMILGGQGKVRYFMRPDLSVTKSNDIWVIGKVPEVFRDKLPNTMVEITQKGYTRLNVSKNKNKCSARGCFDRYHCVRYRIELENDHIGAYNQVPPAWKVGNERCKFFINKNEITIDEGSVE